MFHERTMGWCGRSGVAAWAAAIVPPTSTATACPTSMWGVVGFSDLLIVLTSWDRACSGARNGLPTSSQQRGRRHSYRVVKKDLAGR